MQDRKPGDQTRQSIEPKRNIRLTLAFDGTAYHGWQIQKEFPYRSGMLSDAIVQDHAENL